ncbi:hypothetical protein KY285_009772 [Solanum tuberosum]|nr:hypothetical protein KY285_009772 [Solanum tuberosum]
MRRQVKLVVSCKEELKAKTHIVAYTKEREEDEEKLENIVWCCHISINDNDPLEEGDARDVPPELEEGEDHNTSLKGSYLGTDEDPRPTYLSIFLEVDEEIDYVNLLKEYRDVFSWSYKEMSGLNPKVAVHQLSILFSP